MKISSQLIAARKKAGLSQRAAAKQAGISYVWLCNCENDKGMPTVALLEKLAAVYRVAFTIGDAN